MFIISIPQEIPSVLGNQTFDCRVPRSSQFETFAHMGYYVVNVGIWAQTFRGLLSFTFSRVTKSSYVPRKKLIRLGLSVSRQFSDFRSNNQVPFIRKIYNLRPILLKSSNRNDYQEYFMGVKAASA